MKILNVFMGLFWRKGRIYEADAANNTFHWPVERPAAGRYGSSQGKVSRGAGDVRDYPMILWRCGNSEDNVPRVDSRRPGIRERV